MSDVREVFTIVEDKTTAGLGVALKGKIEGDTVADVQMPVWPCKSSAGGEAKIPLTPDNRVAVSMSGSGTSRRATGVATPVGLLTDTDVSVITLVAGESYQLKVYQGSSFQPVVWRVVHNNDGTPDEIARWVTGAGDFNFGNNSDQSFEFTAGGAGVQELKIIAQQVRGPLSDMHASHSALELET